MARRRGYLKIDYGGSIPKALTEYFSAVPGISAVSFRPLVLNAPDPDRLLNEIGPYLRDSEMRVERIQLRPAGPGPADNAGRLGAA